MIRQKLNKSTWSKHLLCMPCYPVCVRALAGRWGGIHGQRSTVRNHQKLTCVRIGWGGNGKRCPCLGVTVVPSNQKTTFSNAFLLEPLFQGTIERHRLGTRRHTTSKSTWYHMLNYKTTLPSLIIRFI
jgi:hypothetical protein